MSFPFYNPGGPDRSEGNYCGGLMFPDGFHGVDGQLEFQFPDQKPELTRFSLWVDPGDCQNSGKKKGKNNAR